MKSVGMVGLVAGLVSVGFVACGNASRDFEASAGAAGEETEAGAAGKLTGSAGSKAGSTGTAGHAPAAGAAGEEPSEGGNNPGGGTGGEAPAAGSGGMAMGGAPAGGAPAAGSGGMAPVDTTPPSVVSIVPANGAKAIKADTKIVVTFSEPVNKTAAQAALTTSAGNLTFDWNADGTVLTATPVTALTYATTAKAYTVQISTGLADLAGNHSTAAFNSTFSLLRQLELKINKPVTGTWTVSTYPEAYQQSGDGSPTIGDSPSNTYSRVILEFDISGLPAGVTAISQATMTAWINLTNPINNNDWGTAFPDLGNLLVDHIYETSITAATTTKTALNAVGTLMTTVAPTSGDKSIAVTSSVQDDYVNRVSRGNRTQYRLQFAKTTDNDGALDIVAVHFAKGLTLDIFYLIP